MAKKNNIGIWIALIGGGGLLYYYMKNQQPAVVPIVPPVTGPSDLTPISQPIALPVSPSSPLTATPLQIAPMVSANVPGVSSGYANADSAGLTPADMQQIMTWVASLSPARQAQFNATAPLYTVDEWKGLRHLILVAWYGNAGNTPADVDFWNYWRVKYHIADGTIN